MRGVNFTGQFFQMNQCSVNRAQIFVLFFVFVFVFCDAVAAMHGEMPQEERDAIMATFRSGEK